nr:MAG TPA: protein of unknown function (DUF5361) [Caudoviricetes sp.]
MDLLDVWRGSLTLRRVAVLVRGLPAGSALWRAEGGPGAWSAEERAVREGAWLVQSQLLAVFGGSSAQTPQRPSPPAPGWQEEEHARQERQEARARAWAARHPELNSD